jgi:hypothetical protein
VDEIVVTNTVPLERQNLQTHKIRTVDISILLAEAIRSKPYFLVALRVTVFKYTNRLGYV